MQQKLKLLSLPLLFTKLCSNSNYQEELLFHVSTLYLRDKNIKIQIGTSCQISLQVEQNLFL